MQVFRKCFLVDDAFRRDKGEPSVPGRAAILSGEPLIASGRLSADSNRRVVQSAPYYSTFVGEAVHSGRY
jgi:hypothetical protein